MNFDKTLETIAKLAGVKTDSFLESMALSAKKQFEAELKKRIMALVEKDVDEAIKVVSASVAVSFDKAFDVQSNRRVVTHKWEINKGGATSETGDVDIRKRKP